jgi:deoxyribonucleoside regulator
MTSEDVKDMIRVSHLYYEEMLTQEAIARRMNLTRWKIGRLLKQARDSGVVKIEIAHQDSRLTDLEAKLISKFNLDSALVISSSGLNETSLLDAIGQASAQYLSKLTPHPDLIGVTWGRTMNSLARHAKQGWSKNTNFVQLNGALSISSVESSQNGAAKVLAKKADGNFTLLPVPAIVDLESVRQGLERDSTIAHILSLGKSAPVAAFSVGALTPNSVLVESGYLTKDEVKVLLKSGAVGDVLGRFISSKGAIVDKSLNSRTLGLTLEELKEKPIRIAISHGRTKIAVTAGALAAGLVTTLITDEEIASYLLESV